MGQRGDKVKIDKVLSVLEQFEKFCDRRKNTSYEGTYSFLEVSLLTSEFRGLKDSLIRDRIVLGVTDNHVRERLLRVLALTLKKAFEISRAAVAAQSQLR